MKLYLKIKRAIRFLFYKHLPVEDQIKVMQQLNDDNLLRLFWQLSMQDRHHSVEVLERTINVTFDNESPSIKELESLNNLFTLSLIHDIGKSISHFSWIFRIFSELKIVNNNNTIILLAGIAACVGMYFTSKQAASMNSNLNLSNQNRLLLSIGVGAGSATVVAATAAAAMKSKNKNNKLKNKDGITQLYDTVTNTTSSAAVAVSPDDIDVMMTTNEIWANLKTFSMLTVRQHNTSSIHRLLQSLLRTSQTNIEQEKSIYCCYKSIHSLWIFNPSKTVTWKEAGKILAHAKSICMYICTPKLQTKLQFSV